MRNVDDVMVGSYFKNISKRAKDLSRVQQQVATGKSFVRPSESPTEAIKLMRINRDLENTERQTQRLHAKREVLVHSGNVLANIDDFMLEINDLALQSLSETVGKESREAISMQINTLMEEIAQEASREYMDEPLIGHFVRYDGEWGDFAKVNETNNSELYISYMHRLELMPQDEIVPMLNKLNDFNIALKEGDLASARTSMDEYTDMWKGLSEMTGLMGSREQFIDSVITRNEIIDLNYSAEVSRIEDLDVAKASIDLSVAENAYTLAIEVSRRLQEILDPSQLLV